MGFLGAATAGRRRASYHGFGQGMEIGQRQRGRYHRGICTWRRVPARGRRVARRNEPPEGIEPPLRGLKPRVLPLDQSGSWTPARRLSPRLVVDDDAAVAYFCLRWNGVLRCAFDARGDGVVAAPDVAVRTSIETTL